MKTYDNFLSTQNSSIQGNILDSLDKKDILSVSLKIKATHAGKVNGNDIFYTPRSMRKGANTLLIPFQKHLQNLHYGNAVGVINGATYTDYLEKYSPEFQEIALRIETATTAKELVKAVKELIKQDEYKAKDYKGLGVVQVSADLYDESLIEDLATGTNKGKVSIGGNSSKVYCSECGELFRKKHRHIKGNVYNGEECFAIYDDMVLDHIGFVPDPADETTETVIVAGIQDSLEENDASVSIEHIKIQDNLQGTKNHMKIEELKSQLQKDNSYLAGLVADLNDEQKTILSEKYSTDTKNLRASSFLFTEEKLLAIKTKEQVALAKLALATLEDSEEKTALLEMLKVHEEKYFKEEDSLENFLKELTETLTKEAAPEPTPENKEPEDKEPEEKGTEPATKEGDLPTDVQPTVLTQEVLNTILTHVTEAITSQLKAPEPTPIQDSVQFGTLLNRNKQLELDIEAVDKRNVELEQKYKDSLISQILFHKGIDSEDEYAKLLQDREVDSLSLLLDDTKFDLARLAKKTDVTPAEPTKEPKTDLEKAPIKDSLDDGKDEPATIQDNKEQLSDADIIRKHGIAYYLKTQKNSKDI